MSSKTLYPNTISQSSESGTRFRKFKDLNNLKNSTSSYAISEDNIASSSGTHNRPSTITTKYYKANIPAGSKITKITLEYAACYTGNISIAGPSLDLLNVSATAKTGKALTKTMTKTSVSWTGNFSVNSVNSSSFGATINFPSNTKSDIGKVKVQYVRLIIEYNAPNFTLSATKVSGQYTNDDFIVKLTCNNKGQTNGGTNVNITLPSGVTFIRQESGDGTISSNRVWNTNIGSKLSASVVFRVRVNTDGAHNLSFKESATNHTASLNLKSIPALPIEPEPEPEDDPQIIIGDVEEFFIQVKPNEEFTLDLNFTGYNKSTVKIYSCVIGINTFGGNFNNYSQDNCTENILIYSMSLGQWGWRAVTIVENQHISPWNYELSESAMQNKFKCLTPGEYCLAIYDVDNTTSTGLLRKINISVKPNSEALSTPNCTILKLSSEELDRLGEGAYIVQSYMKNNITSDFYHHDWGRNFRIGVFNNEVPGGDSENLTMEEIFKNAIYWSNSIKEGNNFELLTCEFIYDEDYPLYLLFTGDYPEGDPVGSSLQFTTPVIKEDEGMNNQCIFPEPIRGIISKDDSLSQLTLGSFESSNPIRLYDFDTNDIESLEKISILGFQVNITCDVTDNLILLVKLINPNGVTRERSIQITNTRDDRIVSLGGAFDLWGFDVGDLKNLDEWQVEIIVSNPWNNVSESVLTIEHVELIFFANKIKDYLIKCYLNGQDTSHYGMFLEEVDIPTGLKTDVKYLDNAGTDRNDAYRQNIDKKEITIKFSIHGCTLEETTNMLRLIGALFTNKRDELNRPIPNNLEFSHYPGQYWPVIMEDPIDSDVGTVDYSSTLKLIVPDGTSFSTRETVTSFAGNINSIAKINPTLELIPSPEANQVTIRELESKQVMVLNYDSFVEGDIVQVDCENQKVWLKRYSSEIEEYMDYDITFSADWHCDWFSLIGAYYFECENATLRTVSFIERG
ncbi:TPA_asm: distal tail protein [Methanobrevibacter gottschalkii virus vir075]|uniref:Phage tail protein n=1 Tax=Methanobrevibacter gottschalkii TaxID=190974 RepID=A0A1H7ICY3_9EURY|nr:phage tail domain-containing protein [Methanobrevibacter gottschalkii]SEK59390.1 Phage tail protein [Methanobrevibacter gottschalkii]